MAGFSYLELDRYWPEFDPVVAILFPKFSSFVLRMKCGNEISMWDDIEITSIHKEIDDSEKQWWTRVKKGL